MLARANDSGVAGVTAAYVAFAEARPALYDAMFTLASELPFARDETPDVMKACFAELLAVIEPVADGQDAGTLTEVFWSTLHGLITLDRGRRLSPEHRDGRLALVVARFGALPASPPSHEGHPHGLKSMRVPLMASHVLAAARGATDLLRAPPGRMGAAGTRREREESAGDGSPTRCGRAGRPVGDREDHRRAQARPAARGRLPRHRRHVPDGHPRRAARGRRPGRRGRRRQARRQRRLRHRDQPRPARDPPGRRGRRRRHPRARGHQGRFARLGRAARA